MFCYKSTTFYFVIVIDFVPKSDIYRWRHIITEVTISTKYPAEPYLTVITYSNKTTRKLIVKAKVIQVYCAEGFILNLLIYFFFFTL